MKKTRLLLVLLIISLLGNAWQIYRINRMHHDLVFAQNKYIELAGELSDFRDKFEGVSAEFKQEADWIRKTKQREDELVQASNNVIRILRSENDALKTQSAKAESERMDARNDQPAEITPTERPIEKTPRRWVAVTNVSGHGVLRTAPFEITGDSWRIHWQMKLGTVEGVSYLMVASEGASTDLLVNTDQPSDEITYGQGKGIFDLSINSFNCDWDITIEQQI